MSNVTDVLKCDRPFRITTEGEVEQEPLKLDKPIHFVYHEA